MARGDVHYPHRIGYRLDDEAWLELKKVVAGTGFSPHDWCRMAALEKLNNEYGLTRNERILFEQVARIQYLLGRGLCDGIDREAGVALTVAVSLGERDLFCSEERS